VTTLIWKIFLSFQFTQNMGHRRYLFKTYPNHLVYASPTDLYWGIGVAKGDTHWYVPETWRGENRLGDLLTRVRNEMLFDPAFALPKLQMPDRGGPPAAPAAAAAAEGGATAGGGASSTPVVAEGVKRRQEEEDHQQQYRDVPPAQLVRQDNVFRYPMAGIDMAEQSKPAKKNASRRVGRP
jgi:hypothetical protein